MATSRTRSSITSTSTSSSSSRASGTLRVVRPPSLTDYTESLSWQRSFARARASSLLNEDLLILLEHPHVITLGRGSHESNLLATRQLLAERSVAVHEIERGGDVTYHGPGQLVGYPIIDLNRHKKDLHWYLRQLEEVLIRALAEVGIECGRISGHTGVWVEDRKIASIGVHVTRWVTFHGFALNVSTDLSYFDLIIPCGIDAVKMTSMEQELEKSCVLAEVASQVTRSFAEVFELTPEPAELEDVQAQLSSAEVGEPAEP